MTRLLRALAALTVCCVLLSAAASAQADIAINFDDQPASPSVRLVDQYAAQGVEFGHPSRWGLDLGAPAGCSGDNGTGSAVIAAGGIAGNSLAVQCIGLVPGGADTNGDLGYSIGWRFPVKRRQVSFQVRVQSVDLYSGVFAEPGPFPVIIRALNSNGTLVDSASLLLTTGAVSAVNFDHGATQDIAYVLITGSQGKLHVDTITAPTDAIPPPPEYALALTTSSLSLAEGETGSVPVKVVRFGGSTGAISVHVNSLPTGIVAVSADPIGGTASTALRVTASSPATGDRQVTVSADPNGMAGTLVSGAFTLSIHLDPALFMDRTTVGASPGCGTNRTSFGFTVRGGYHGLVGVTITKLSGPATLSSYPTIVQAVGSGGASVPISVSSDQLTESPTGYDVLLTPAGATPVHGALAVYSSAAEAVSFSGVDSSFIYHAPGSVDQHQQVIVRGNFPASCPTTFKDDQGNPVTQLGSAPQAPGQAPGLRLDLGIDPVTTRIHAADPTSGKDFAVSPVITVAEYRNTFALSQENSGAGAGLSDFNWLDFEAAFGKDDVDVCYDYYCVRHPGMIAYYESLAARIRMANGLCFGWSSQSIAFASKTELPTEFQPGVARAYDIRQFTDDMAIKRNVAVWQARNGDAGNLAEEQKQLANPLSIAEIIKRVGDGARRGRPPLIVIWSGKFGAKSTSGHAVVAYDVRSAADGGIDLITYNPNYPYISNEERVQSVRTLSLARSTIHITPGGTWSGGIWEDKDTAWSGPLTQLEVLDPPPIDAHIPREGETSGGGPGEPTSVKQITIGGRDALRADGSVVEGRGVADISPPTGGKPQATYQLHGSRPAQLHVVGNRTGTYTQSLVGGSVSATVSGARTAKGQEDILTVTPNEAQVAFASSAATTAATLRIDATQRKAAPAGLTAAKAASPVRSVTVALTAGKGRSDVVGLADSGTLLLQHAGPAITVGVTLEGVGEGLPTSAQLAPLSVGPGEQLSIKPAAWADLGAGAAYQVRRAGRIVRSGKAVVLPSKVVRLASGLKLKIKHGANGKGTVTVSGRVQRRGATPGLIVTVSVRKGGKAITTAAVNRRGAKAVKTGAFSVPVSVKLLPRGARLVVTVTLVNEDARFASTHVGRSAIVR